MTEHHQAEKQIELTNSPERQEQVQTYRGVLEFFSETGTEGGYWALQDEHFIQKVPVKSGVFVNSVVFDADNPERRGRTLESAEVLHDSEWDPLPDPMQREADYYESSLFLGGPGGNREADQRLMDKYDFHIHYAADRLDEQYGKGNWHREDSYIAVTSEGKRVSVCSTPSTTPQRPYGLRFGDITRNVVEWEDGATEERLSTTLLEQSWDYEGLHILKDGDKLTIYDKKNSDEVVWEGEVSLEQYGVFTQDAFGYWIHADQRDIDRKTWATWFFQGNPAKLVTKEEFEPQGE